MSRLPLIAVLLASLAIFAPTAGASELSSLPDMGDASTSVLTPERQRRIGKAMWRQLRQAGKIVDNPELNGYIESLGYRLLAATEHTQPEFTFFLVDSPNINAFAMPGGYIGINAGLITATSSEDQLAAVVAHEIAHIDQNHLSRGYQKANRMNLPMTAAMIAAILLGAQDPQLAQAAIAASTAGAAQMQIDFTRAHEKEADRIGIDMLATAGYNAHSMAEFFGTLQKKSRYYGSGVPEFLRTHPVNEARIADAEGRAQQFPSGRRPDDHGYWTTRARLQVELADDRRALVRELRSRLEAGRSPNHDADRFALALALKRIGQLTEARQILESFVDQAPERIAYRTALARLETQNGRYPVAEGILLAGLELYPDNTELLLARGANRLRMGKPAEARNDFDQAIRSATNLPPEAYRQLSRAEAALDHQPASRLALGEYYFRTGETHSAIAQLKSAQELEGADFYMASRIEARLEQFKREAELEALD